MKRLLISLLFMVLGVMQINAQIRLRTPDGRFVLLFDNGTWKYEAAKKVEPAPFAPLPKKETIEEPIQLKTLELPKQTVIKGTSAKLSKFTSANNQIKCDFALSSDGSKLLLSTHWKIMDEEGFRFFGYITKKSTLQLELSNGETVILNYSTDFAPKEYPNYGFTLFKAHLNLTEEQIRDLQKAYIKKTVMKWSRREETYDVFNPDYFVKELPKFLK